ncbi:NuoI/complex I 23 kDa subunit family protein [Planotetraspora kaengkrachanensis]|uniref:NuoI/complex I 23 kDa subunit family protein n=1 Tax=Planotetraspora kaengkrachanensis TaxID=575193 RepID=UPI001EF1F9C1|nr:NADH-quinone oxidoreductase subunit I [Planotetraspora kaengkrachanensis]
MARIPGEGLAKGLAVTLRHMLRKSDTQQYPEVKPDLPPRSRGVIALVEENCTVCMLCARECPDWCIYIDSHKETLPAPEGGRPRARNMLDRFAIDFSLCMYCGICIEVCPFDALFWSPEFEYSEHDIRDLLHEKDRLGEWAATVPPPPAHEIGAEPPKEIAAGSRPARSAETARRPAGDRPVRPAGDRPARPATAAPDDSGTGARPTGTPAEQTTPPGGNGPSEESAPAEGRTPPAESAPRREPPRPMRDIRSIRPPGALPKKPSTPDAPESPGDPAKDGPGEDA